MLIIVTGTCRAGAVPPRHGNVTPLRRTYVRSDMSSCSHGFSTILKATITLAWFVLQSKYVPRHLVRRRDALSQAVPVMISSGIDEWVSRSSCLMCMVGPQVCHDKHFRTRCCCHLWSRPPRPGWCRNVRTCMRTRHIFDTALCSPSNSALSIKIH